MIKLNFNANKKRSLFQKTNDKKKVLINTSLFMLMQFLIVLYALIRVFLINIYLGVTNFGLLNLMISIAPISTILISGVQVKSMYVLYQYSLKKNYLKINEIINNQINEIRKYSYVSIAIVIIFMVFSFFLFKSPQLSGWIIILFILSATIQLLSYGIIVPYVEWYLNSVYKNYIYDAISICFSTILNALIFTIILLFGFKVIIFNNVNSAIGSIYITLIISFLLTAKVYLTNILLFFNRKKYMPWFKRDKNIKNNDFKKITFWYFLHEILAFVAVLMIPIVLYILSIFVNLSTSIAGIYYSYLTFAKLITIIGLLLSSLRPYLAKIFFNKNNLFQLNQLIYKIGFFLILFLSLNLIIISPYIMIFSNSYFSFTISFLMIINVLLFSLKSIDENFIFIHGKPEKYSFLTLYEIIIGLLALIIGFSIIFFIPMFSHNILNILYCLIICEIILRISKYILNVFYLNKYVYKISLRIYLQEYYKIYLFFIVYMIVISLFLVYSSLPITQDNIFTNNVFLSYFSLESIEILYNNKIDLISWPNLILFLFFINVFYIISVGIFLKFYDKNVIMLVKNILKKKVNKKYKNEQ